MTTAWGILDLCSRLGVRLEANGNGFRAFGPDHAKRRVKALVLTHKTEILAVIRSAEAGGRPLLPPDVSGQQWHRDWRGQPVNLFPIRKETDVNQHRLGL